MVDAAGTLHQYQPATEKFRTKVDKDVDRLACGTAAVLVRKTPDKDCRFASHADTEGVEPRILIGKEYGGQIAIASDAVEYRQRLVIAQADKVGFYRWENHDWTTIEAPVTPITDLYTVGDSLWAFGGNKDRGTLLSWDGESRFIPVQAGDERLVIRKVSAGSAGLFVLATDGRVLFIASEHPTKATELLAATRLAATTPVAIRPELTALIDDDLVLFHNQAFHCYAPGRSVARWTSTPFADDEIIRLVSAPDGKLILAQGRANAWFIRKTGGGGRLTCTPILVDYHLGEGVAEVSSVAAGTVEAACAVRVANQSGLHILTQRYNSPNLNTVIGSALPAVDTTRAGTKAVVVDPTSGGLIRLDEGGHLAFYDTKIHSWKIRSPPVASVDELWHLDNQIVAYSRSQATVLFRRDGTWQADPTTKGEVQNVLPFKEGLLLWLKRGAVALLSPQGKSKTIRPEPAEGSAPGKLDMIINAAESDDLLALLDTLGPVCSVRLALSVLDQNAGKSATNRASIETVGYLRVA